LIPKPAPVTATAEITKSALPVLVTKTVFVLVLPTVTLPNERLAGVTVTEIELPDCVGALPPPATTPVLPHPANKKGSKMATAEMPTENVNLQRVVSVYLATSSSRVLGLEAQRANRTESQARPAMHWVQLK